MDVLQPKPRQPMQGGRSAVNTSGDKHSYQPTYSMTLVGKHTYANTTPALQLIMVCMCACVYVCICVCVCVCVCVNAGICNGVWSEVAGSKRNLSGGVRPFQKAQKGPNGSPAFAGLCLPMESIAPGIKACYSSSRVPEMKRSSRLSETEDIWITGLCAAGLCCCKVYCMCNEREWIICSIDIKIGIGKIFSHECKLKTIFYSSKTKNNFDVVNFAYRNRPDRYR